jgi:hypothetical protein
MGRPVVIAAQDAEAATVVMDAAEGTSLARAQVGRVGLVVATRTGDASDRRPFCPLERDDDG